MKLFKSILLVGMICSVSTRVLAEDVISKLPDSTKVVAKLNLDRLRASKVYANIEQNYLDKIEKAQTNLVEQAGIDPSSVKELYLAGVKKNQGMLILKGEFDAAAIKSILELKPNLPLVARNDVELAVYLPDKKSGRKNLAVIIDKNTLAIGSPDFVDAFISNIKGKGSPLGKEKIEKAQTALSKDSLFQGILLESPAANDTPNPIMTAIQGGNATLDVTDKVTCEADITVDTEKNAKKITQVIYGLLAFYEMKQPKSYKGEIAKDSILKNLKIEQKGNAVTIKGGLGDAVVQQLIERIN